MMKVNTLFFVTDFVLHAKSCPVVYSSCLPPGVLPAAVAALV